MSKLISFILIGFIGIVSLSSCSWIDDIQKHNAEMSAKQKIFKAKMLEELSQTPQVIDFLKEAKDKYKVVDVDDSIYLAWIFLNSKNKIYNNELLKQIHGLLIFRLEM